MELNEKQNEILNCNDDVIFVEAAAASGKAQPNSTIIPTPNGYKTINELQIGDYVFNRKGQPEKILGVYPQGKQKVFRVTLADGRQTLCAPDHLWSYDNGHNSFTTKTIENQNCFGNGSRC